MFFSHLLKEITFADSYRELVTGVKITTVSIYHF